MSASLRALKLVLAVRRRQRDLTASATMVAESRLASAGAAEADAVRDLDEVLDPDARRAHSGPAALEQLDRERQIAVGYCLVAKAAHQIETVATEKARAELRVHARALRVSEKIVERVVDERAVREGKREQLAFDDISATRRARRS